MPRIPTIQEAQEQAESLLSKLLAEAFPESNAIEFFEKLERQIKAKLNVQLRIRITRLVVTCRIRGRHALEVADLRKANRLVKSTRREIALIHKIVKKAEVDIATSNLASKDALAVRRECWSLYKNAVQHHQHLSVLTDSSDPHERLAEAEVVVHEALHLVSPFRYSDFEGALTLLNALLANWPTATKSKRGQEWRGRIVNEAILRLAQIYKEATGRPAKDKNSFKQFADSVLSCLPPALYPQSYDDTLATLSKRLKRLRLSSVQIEQFEGY